MARPLAEKLLVRGRLVATTPISVGGVDDPGVDLALATDGMGRHYVPGTSLTGPLRHWAQTNLRPELTRPESGLLDQVLGFQGPEGTTRGHASWLTVENAPLQEPGPGRLEIRDGVGIDRRTGAAAQGVRFERRVLARGTALDLRLELDVPPADAAAGFDPEDAKRLLEALIVALLQGEVRLGGAKTRGLGRVRLEDEGLEVHRYEVARKPEHLFRWLRGEPSPMPLPDGASLLQLRPRLEVKVHWRPLTPVLVQAGAAGVGVDCLPLVGSVGTDRVAAVLPGSSIKGALRSHGERILRTLGGYRTATGFLEQLDLPVARDLFGSVGSAGWLLVPDVYQEGALLPVSDQRAERFGSWGAREDHVAIDRFTGGAATGQLFSVQEPPLAGWEPLVLEIELPPVGEAAEDRDRAQRRRAALGLLLLVLRDLAAGRVPLGFGVNRGLGAIAVERVEIESSGEAVAEVPTMSLRPGEGYAQLGPERGRDLVMALERCLEQGPEGSQGHGEQGG